MASKRRLSRISPTRSASESARSLDTSGPRTTYRGGEFDAGLAALREQLAAQSEDLPVLDAVNLAVVEFNRLDPQAVPQHRQRMALIMNTPSLQAYSALRYEDWRAVICEYAANRYGREPWDLLPRTIGHVSLALSLSAYEQWLLDEDSDLLELLRATGPVLRLYLDGD